MILEPTKPANTVPRFNYTAPPELERIVQKCLEKDPKQRYQSVADLRVDLERLKRDRHSQAVIQTYTARTGAKPQPGGPARREKPRGNFPRNAILAGLMVAVAGAVVWVLRHRPVQTAHAGLNALAVIPLQSLGSDRSSDFLRFAVPDEITTTLSYIPSVAVRPFELTRKYSEADFDPAAVARDLHVSCIVTGHYLRAADQLRITLEAIDTESNRVLWQETVSGDARDLVGLQNQITTRVRQGLLPLLGAPLAAGMPATRPTNQPAYDLFLRGAAMPHGAAPSKEAIQMLRQAVEIDPVYAPTWVELSHREYQDAEYADGGGEAYQRAEAAAQRAHTLDPGLLDATYNLLTFEVEKGELSTAYDEARDLLKRRPESAAAHFCLAYVLRYAGLLEESAHECETVMALDPGNANVATCAVTFLQLGRYERASEYIRRAPSRQWAALINNEILLRESKVDEALHAMPDYPEPDRDYTRACLEHQPASVIGPLWRRSDANVRTIRDPEPKYFEAAFEVHCGQPKAALQLLRVAVEGGYCVPFTLDHDPFLNNLRGSPAFAGIRVTAMECQNKFLAHRAQQNP